MQSDDKRVSNPDFGPVVPEALAELQPELIDVKRNSPVHIRDVNGHIAACDHLDPLIRNSLQDFVATCPFVRLAGILGGQGWIRLADPCSICRCACWRSGLYDCVSR